MKAGTLVALIDPDVHKQANLVFTLSADKLNIQWEVKGLSKKLAITDIRELRFGLMFLSIFINLMRHQVKKPRYLLDGPTSTTSPIFRSPSFSVTDSTR